MTWEILKEPQYISPTTCHGDDCAETTYVGIETLAGVSTRLSDQKIIEGGEMFGSAPTSRWSDEDRTILLPFILGL